MEETQNEENATQHEVRKAIKRNNRKRLYDITIQITKYGSLELEKVLSTMLQASFSRRQVLEE